MLFKRKQKNKGQAEKRAPRTSKRRINNYAIDRNAKSKNSTTPASQNTNHKKKRSKYRKLFKNITKVIVSIIILSTLITAYIRLHNTNTKLNSYYSQISKESCSQYTQNIVNSYLEIITDKNDTPQRFIIYIYTKEKTMKIDISDIQIPIDMDQNLGNLKRYFYINNFFVDQPTLLENLRRVILNELNLKIDHIFITKEEYSFSSYISDFNKNFLFKIFTFDKKQNLIQGTLCQSTLNRFLIDLTSETITYPQENIDNLNFKSYFNLTPIIKEQTRIYIINKTGVSKWGSTVSDIMKKYGLNVVKIDNVNEFQSESKIFTEDSTSAYSNTVSLIKYLLSEEIKLNDNQSDLVFADMYVELGTDMLF